MPIMKAVVIHEPGGPEVLKVESIPIPTPLAGQVLIRVKAFGINRSEMFTRQGHSPGVRFPRVLGIEAVGLVEEVPGDEFRKGDIVATAMGGMGRNRDARGLVAVCEAGRHCVHDRDCRKQAALRYSSVANVTLLERNPVSRARQLAAYLLRG